MKFSRIPSRRMSSSAVGERRAMSHGSRRCRLRCAAASMLVGMSLCADHQVTSAKKLNPSDASKPVRRQRRCVHAGGNGR